MKSFMLIFITIYSQTLIAQNSIVSISQDLDTGCFVESMNELPYLNFKSKDRFTQADFDEMKSLKVLTRGESLTAEPRAAKPEDFNENFYMFFYNSEGNKLGEYWPYATSKKIDDQTNEFGMPAYMTVKKESKANTIRITITKRVPARPGVPQMGPFISTFICKSSGETEEHSPAINTSEHSDKDSSSNLIKSDSASIATKK